MKVDTGDVEGGLVAREVSYSKRNWFLVTPMDWRGLVNLMR